MGIEAMFSLAGKVALVTGAATGIGLAPGVSEAREIVYGMTAMGRLGTPRDVAAIILEPIQGEGGYVVPSPDFLKGLREMIGAR